MSYRRAWLLVEELNGSFQTALVAADKGGAHGGGARLTDLGARVLKHFRSMEAQDAQGHRGRPRRPHRPRQTSEIAGL